MAVPMPLAMSMAAQHWILYAKKRLVDFLRDSRAGGEHDTPLVHT